MGFLQESCCEEGTEVTAALPVTSVTSSSGTFGAFGGMPVPPQRSAPAGSQPRGRPPPQTLHLIPQGVRLLASSAASEFFRRLPYREPRFPGRLPQDSPGRGFRSASANPKPKSRRLSPKGFRRGSAKLGSTAALLAVARCLPLRFRKPRAMHGHLHDWTENMDFRKNLAGNPTAQQTATTGSL